MGRPAINTVFNTSLVDANAGATKNAFNRDQPSRQLTALDGQFRKNIVTTLTNINQVLGTDDAFGCSDWHAPRRESSPRSSCPTSSRTT